MHSIVHLFSILQKFIWPLARSASPEESVVVELHSQTTQILFNPGRGSPSTSKANTSWGTINNKSEFIGRYVMLMQGELQNTSNMEL